MMKSLRQNKGITLIALVITIIVLLLLAGVAISMLTGENGIINQTNSAKTETGKAEEKESVQLATLTALTVGNGEIVSNDAITALQNELEKAGCKNFAEINSLPATAEMPMGFYKIDEYGNVSEYIPSELEKLIGGPAMNEKTTVADSSGKQVVIPELFKVAADSATLVKEGVVVIAPDDSEFVWVPVEDINSMVMCQGSTGANNCKITLSEDKLICTTHPGKDICGKLYATKSGENFSYTLNTQTYNRDTGTREPSSISNDFKAKGIELLKSRIKLTGSDDDVKLQWENNLQNEYEQMAKSVFDNKGFYVGRYETSIDDNYKAQSKANQLSTSAGTKVNEESLMWYGLYQLDKEYNINGENLENIVGSTMMWGSQYDQMMLWMYNNGEGIDVTSNDFSNLKDVIPNEDGKVTGGVGDKDILNNVYDLLGCKNEWTIESCTSTFDSRLWRGGCKGRLNSPSRRGENSPDTEASNISSRLALYIK